MIVVVVVLNNKIDTELVEKKTNDKQLIFLIQNCFIIIHVQFLRRH